MSEVDVSELAAQLVMTSNHGVRAKAAAELLRLSMVEVHRAALQATLNACAIYLKDGETPAQRIHRDHCDALALMSLLAQEKRKSEALLEALKHAEAALADIGDADREPGDDLAWCETRAAEALPRIRAAITKTEGT